MKRQSVYLGALLENAFYACIKPSLQTSNTNLILYLSHIKYHLRLILVLNKRNIYSLF